MLGIASTSARLQQTPTSRVLLVYHSQLFAHSVRAALCAQPEITLVGEVPDWTRAGAEIARLIPDAVIVEEDGREAVGEVLGSLRGQAYPRRVVALRLDETAMRIWSGTQQEITCKADLIDAVRV